LHLNPTARRTNCDSGAVRTNHQIATANRPRSSQKQFTLSFLITSIGLIVMLLWAGSYEMTAPGAEGIVPLVSNRPLISWHFKLFGTYIGSDFIGLTEIIAALFMIAGYLRPKAGIIGALIATVMFSIYTV
jgi:uncharacterized membrane protein YkgB